MTDFILDTALLPDGWADEVGLSVEAGVITRVSVGGAAPGATRLRGITLPGMPNLHSHTFQRGMAGLGERAASHRDGVARDTFWTWREVMYRFLGALTPDDVEAIAAFAMLEMLQGGFTALAEFHYLHHGLDGRPYADRAELAGRIAAAAAETGIGLTLLPVFYAHGGFGGVEPNDGQRRFVNDPDGFARLMEGARAVVSRLDDGVVGVAPHSLRAVTPDSLAAVTDGHAGPVHIHVAEQVKEVEDCLAWSGQRPVAWLLANAPVDERWCLIHATHMNPAETREVARRGAVAGLCPLTEANLGDGTFNGAEFLAADGRWGIGTDSNIEITAAGELKQFEYSQRLALRARNVLAPTAGGSTGRRLHHGALAGGRQALGRRVGAIAEGDRADLVVLDRSHPDLAHARGDQILDVLVFALGSRAVRDVYVGGRQVLADRQHARGREITARYASAIRRLAAL